jgi:hypothetical protein
MCVRVCVCGVIRTATELDSSMFSSYSAHCTVQRDAHALATARLALLPRTTPLEDEGAVAIEKAPAQPAPASVSDSVDAAAPVESESGAAAPPSKLSRMSLRKRKPPPQTDSAANAAHESGSETESEGESDETRRRKRLKPAAQTPAPEPSAVESKLPAAAPMTHAVVPAPAALVAADAVAGGLPSVLMEQARALRDQLKDYADTFLSSMYDRWPHFCFAAFALMRMCVTVCRFYQNHVSAYH